MINQIIIPLRPPPLTPYHHLLTSGDPSTAAAAAAAASSRPFLLAASLYGHLPPPSPTVSGALSGSGGSAQMPSTFSLVDPHSSEPISSLSACLEQKRGSSINSGGPLDLSHLAASVGSTAAAAAGVRAAAAAAAAVHPFFQLHKAASGNGMIWHCGMYFLS